MNIFTIMVNEDMSNLEVCLYKYIYIYKDKNINL